MKWFRFYHEVLHDSKVQTLGPELFRSWINVLCIASGASERGTLPDLKQVAFLLRVREAKAREILDGLLDAGLLDEQPDGTLKPHNWNDRQPESDNNNERVRQYRERIRRSGASITGYTKHKVEVFARDGHACVYCLSTKKLVLDHLIPVIRGGDDQPDNLVVACKACNSGKAGRLVEESGYAFKNAAAAALYEAAKSRFHIVSPCDALSPDVTVTGRRVTVTVTPRTRVDSDSEPEPEPETDAEQNPHGPPAGGVMAEDGTLPHEAREVIEEARIRHGDGAAALVRREARAIDRQLGGRFDLFLEALDAASARRPKLEDRNVFSWCMARAKARINSPPRALAPPGQLARSERRQKQDDAFEAAAAAIEEEL